MTDTKVNEDGSIQTRMDASLKEIELQLEVFKLSSEQIERDTQRLDSYFSNIKSLFAIVSGSIGFVFVAFSFLGYSSITDMRTQVVELVPVLVQETLITEGKLTGNAQSLVDKAHTTVDKIKRLKSDLEKNIKPAEVQPPDIGPTSSSMAGGQFAYERADELQKKDEITEQDRREAAVLLGSLVDLGQQGGVNPNTLFNASVVADRFDFVVEASKLASLAYGWKPSTSHRAKMLEAQDILGIAYSLDTSSKKLIESDLSGPEAKLAAWEEMLALVSQNPRIEGEQAYSRAQNIAVRNRSQGYFTQLIDAINEAGRQDPDGISSYAYKSLAELHTWRGNRGWEAEFWIAVDKAVEKLSTESPRSSWYGHTARELLDEANRLDELPRMVEIFEKHGLDKAAIVRAAEATGR